jgi:dihydroorotase-like cyclic amidohydrolase
MFVCLSEGFLMARPEELEEEAVKRACVLARKANVPIVVCGPTSKEALAVIAEERSKGQVKNDSLTNHGIKIFLPKLLYNLNFLEV